MLIEHENLLNIKKCILVVHSIGHAGLDSLDILKRALEVEGIKYCVIDFEGIE